MGLVGLEGTRGVLAVRRDGVIELGVDSVTDDSSDVVGSESGGPMGEGPGKGSGTELIEVTEGTGRRGVTAGRSEGNSVDKTEGLNTDPGSEMPLAILVVETVGMLSISEGELIAERSSCG